MSSLHFLRSRLNWSSNALRVLRSSPFTRSTLTTDPDSVVIDVAVHEDHAVLDLFYLEKLRNLDKNHLMTPA
jgi:hypothetical protein